MHRVDPCTAGEDEADRLVFIEARRVGNACGDILNESASVIKLVQISNSQGRLGETAPLLGDPVKVKLKFAHSLCNLGFTLCWFWVVISLETNMHLCFMVIFVFDNITDSGSVCRGSNPLPPA